MDWNNGTIFRAFINIGDNRPVIEINANRGVPHEVDVKLDIAQQELTGTVFIGIENFVVKPRVASGNPANPTAEQVALQNYWANLRYLQLESFQLPPYIDYTSQEFTGPGFEAESQNASRNTQIFARLPLIATPSLGNANLTTQATFASDRVLNKDSILYEMRNNPFALSNGRLRFRILDEYNQPLRRTFGALDLTAILALSFTLVIYKPNDTYN